MSIWQRVAGILTGATRADSVSGALGRLGDTNAPDRADPLTDIRFTMALIALCAKMARSDGAVTVDEVEAFRRIVHVPVEEEANVRRLFDLAKADVAGFKEYAQQIGKLFASERQLQLDVLESLFVIATADGILHEKEDDFLTTVAGILGIRPTEQDHIRSLFVTNAASPYQILGVTPSSTDAEIKARHRTLVLDNHPDRLTGRGVPAEFVVVAERRLAAINAAFDAIARERGL